MRKIYFNGKIYIEEDVFAKAILVEDGTIRAVGSMDEVRTMAGDLIVDEMVDLGGRTVIPGFNDSHLHLSLVGENLRTCDLSGARSISDLIALGRSFLEAHPQITHLIGKGWNQELFSQERRFPDRFDLDAISTDRPIIFDRVCLHVAAANSKALALLGVDSGTGISGGEIHRDKTGAATGVFTENGVGLLHRLIPARNRQELIEDFKRAMDYAVSVGITSVQSCDVLMSPDFQNVFDAIGALARSGALKLRYTHQFNLSSLEDFQDYLEHESQNAAYDESWYSRGALKLFKDGSLGGRTALLQRDYQDAPGVRGIEALTDDAMLQFCRLAQDHGVQVVTHAIGDEAIRRVIKVYAQVMPPGNPLRHGIVHNQITTRDLLADILRLKIPVMAQPIFLQADMAIIEDRVGRELAESSYAFHSLIQMGGLVSLSTDAPVEDCAPLKNLHMAVNRTRADGTPPGGYQPEEKMSVAEALDAYTAGSAANEGKGHFKGRLKPGFVADLVILAEDLFTVDPLTIGDIQVLETIVGGKTVYRFSEEPLT